MGEYFAAQAGMGEYMQAAAGMGEGPEYGPPMSAQAGAGAYLQASAGMGSSDAERFLRWAAANPDAARRLIAQRRAKSGNVMRGVGEYFAGTDGALVDWARQEETEAGHAGIFGLGEFFVPRGTNGLGTIEGSAATPWIWAIGAGAVIGALAVTFSKNSKLGAAGLGAAAGIAAVVASRAVYG